MSRTACVFGGVTKIEYEGYVDSAYMLGERLAGSGWDLICSGTKRGLVGAVIEGAVAQTGNISAFIVMGSGEKEMLHPGVNKVVEAASLAERKDKMQQAADVFLALPGGIGTLDEIFNVIACGRMGLHSKKIGLLNFNGFFSPLSAFLSQLVMSGFAREKHFERLYIESDLDRLFERLA